MSKSKIGKPIDRIDRILWNRGRKTVDEIVVHNCTVHLEQMTDQSYWIGIYRGDGARDALAVDLWVDGGRKPLLCRVRDDSAGGWPWDRDDEHL